MELVSPSSALGSIWDLVNSPAVTIIVFLILVFSSVRSCLQPFRNIPDHSAKNHFRAILKEKRQNVQNSRFQEINHIKAQIDNTRHQDFYELSSSVRIDKTKSALSKLLRNIPKKQSLLYLTTQQRKLQMIKKEQQIRVIKEEQAKKQKQKAQKENAQKENAQKMKREQLASEERKKKQLVQKQKKQLAEAANKKKENAQIQKNKVPVQTNFKPTTSFFIDPSPDDNKKTVEVPSTRFIPQTASLFSNKQKNLTAQINLVDHKNTIAPPADKKQVRPVINLVISNPLTANSLQKNPIPAAAPNPIIPISNIPLIPIIRAEPRPVVQNSQNLSVQDYLDKIIEFVRQSRIQVQIPLIMSNIGGSRSSLKTLFTQNKSLINPINKADDKQINAFALKLYQGIINLIDSTNKTKGLYRMPPKSRTDQEQKNSINSYIMHINLYRMMGYQKIWLTILGKLLQCLQFIYKRREDLKTFEDLDLLKNKHLQKKGIIQQKYLSRMDYLTYFLFGLTSFDPVLVFRQLEPIDRQIRPYRQEIQSWGTQWSYREFWIITGAIFRNPHESYFKPILYINLLSTIYPQIQQHKLDQNKFKAHFDLYKNILVLGKKYFQKYKNLPEIKNLASYQEGSNYQYDGKNLQLLIKTLESRICNQKLKQFSLPAHQFQKKCSVLYYFVLPLLPD